MFGARRNGVVSRSFHGSHGVRINDPKKSSPAKVKRKLSWANGLQIRNASSEGVLTHRPVILKEGFLSKPSFFRFVSEPGGRKRRWCVLRTYTQTEASLDIYLDETKSRYKGSISLDREVSPFLIVKNADGKKKSSKQCYLSIKVGKNTHQFTTDSFRDLKEWCALIRQAMDNVKMFSGRVTEPATLADEGMVNVKFNANCIALLCALKETPIKTWRLDHITSFGQCGGILTFECCSSCSDPSTSRCSITIIQEKPAVVLNLMERAIRNNPNTSEIHYERSILGDIYHCDHECGVPGRMIPAFSDPNLFRSASASPQKGIGIGLGVVPVDMHYFNGMPTNTMESSDSGLPGTPQAEETMSVSSSIPSPTESNRSNIRTSPFRSPKHNSSAHNGYYYKGRSMSDSRPSPPHALEALRMFARRQSDEPVYPPGPPSIIDQRKISDSIIIQQQQQQKQHHPRLMYAMISHDSSPKLLKKEESSFPTSPVAYATVQTKSDSPQPPRYNRLHPVNEFHEFTEADQVIYDEPNCEPYNPLSPPPTPLRPNKKKELSSSRTSAREPLTYRSPSRTPKSSAASTYAPGTDLAERSEDFQDLPPVPRHRRRQDKEFVQLKGVPFDKPRRRLQSSSEVLEAGSTRHSHCLQPARSRGSMDNLDNIGRNRNRSHSIATGCDHMPDRKLHGNADILARLHEEEERLCKVLNASKRERNEELLEARDRLGELNRPFRFTLGDDYDEPDPDVILETSSNVLDYHSRLYSSPTSADKVLTKVASDTVRGYAYKIAIPVANTQYDVPRRAAPAPDLSKVRDDAPPKPIRYSSSENLRFMNY